MVESGDPVACKYKVLPKIYECLGNFLISAIAELRQLNAKTDQQSVISW